MNDFKYAVFDMEASQYNYDKSKSDVIDLVGFYDGYDYYAFNNVKEFVDFLIEKKQYNNYKLYAHNGGKYDFLFVLEELKRRELLHKITGLIIRGSSLMRFSVRFSNDLKYDFRDSFRLMPSSLRKLGKAFGYEKGHLDKCNTFEELIEYNKNDCIVLYNVIKNFKNELRLQSLPLTAPALSLNEFLKINGVKNVSQICVVGKYDSFARQSYVGGRVEVFVRDVEQPSVCLDVNSLYPAVMHDNLYPVGVPEFLDDENDVKREFLKGKLGIYEVDWCAPDMYTPVLWEKDIEEKKLYFRVNRDKEFKGHGIYAYPELACARENGYLLNFRRALVYDEKDDIFSDFVEKFYEMKKKGGAKKEIAKIILNSCYGKFGQKREVEHLFFSRSGKRVKEMAKLTAYIREKNFQNVSKLVPVDFKLGMFVLQKEMPSKNFNVAIASMITSYARVFLFNSMKKVGFSQYYCDTDSLFIPEKYAKNLDIDDSALGKWKIEYEFDKAMFISPKLYIIKSNKIICKAKGVPSDVIYSITEKEFDEAVENLQNGVFKSYLITPFKQAIRMGLPFGKTREVEKVLTLQNSKRMFLEDGTSVPY